MSIYFNEFAAFPAQWLRNLIDAGHIALGAVDERSIKEVQPDDLIGYSQCHFFAGIGVWSYALKLAGWPDDREVWTGSCPCQPFSAAGKRGGTDDPRHLWPEWFRLIRERRPSVIFGEQVASKDGLAWLDLVYSDLESAGYAVAAVDLCAASAGAPHIRQRLYFVAHAKGSERGLSVQRGRPRQTGTEFIGGGEVIPLADSQGEQMGHDGQSRGCAATGSELADAPHGDNGAGRTWRGSAGLADSGNLGDASGQGRTQQRRQWDEPQGFTASNFWSDLEWLQCRDGKARPTKPGLFPLAHGATARVGRLRAYGNAIVGPLAAEFIKAYMEIIHA